MSKSLKSDLKKKLKLQKKLTNLSIDRKGKFNKLPFVTDISIVKRESVNSKKYRHMINYRRRKGMKQQKIRVATVRVQSGNFYNPTRTFMDNVSRAIRASLDPNRQTKVKELKDMSEDEKEAIRKRYNANFTKDKNDWR